MIPIHFIQQVTRWGVRLGMLLVFGLLVLTVISVLGIASPGVTDAGVAFPRVSQNEAYGIDSFTCPAGYSAVYHGFQTCPRCGNENARWMECVNRSFNNPQPPPAAAPLGSHDTAQCPGGEPNSSANVLTGWACDPDNWNATLQVEVYRDGLRGGGGTYVGAATANQFRQDVVNANVCGGTGNHGFTFQIPEDLRDNTSHSYYVYAIDDGTNGGAGNPLLGGSPKAATCTIPPPSSPTASCLYNSTRNLFEVTYSWGAPPGYNTFYTRISDTSGFLDTSPGWRNDFVGTTHRFDLSNEVATNPDYASDKEFSYWIHTRWLHPSDPNNAYLWRWSAATPVSPNDRFVCPLPAPLTPTIANATCVGSFASTDAEATFSMDSEFAARYNIEYTRSGGSTITVENQPALTTRSLPWGRYTWRVQGENRTDTKGPWQMGNSFECRPPDPVITIAPVTSDLVTAGSSINLNWSVQANYPVNCVITGGGINRSVTHTGLPLQSSGTVTTNPINNTTDFTIVCTPDIEFLPGMPGVSRTARVEVVPQFEER